jgi:hypothetical protein
MASSSIRNNPKTAPGNQSKRQKHRHSPSPPAASRKRTKDSHGRKTSSGVEEQDPEESDSEDEFSAPPSDEEDNESSTSDEDDEQIGSQGATRRSHTIVSNPPNPPVVELLDSRNDQVSRTKAPLVTSTPRNVEDLMQPTPDGILSIAVEVTKPLATRYALFETPFPSPDVKATQIVLWWQQQVAKEQPELWNTEVPKSFTTAVSWS